MQKSPIKETIFCSARSLRRGCSFCSALMPEGSSGLLQNIVSFIGLFCKRDNLRRGCSFCSALMPQGSSGLLRVIRSFARRTMINGYGVATISRRLKIIRLFCRIWSLLLGSFATETYNFHEPTHCSHPIQHRTAKCARFCHFIRFVCAIFPTDWAQYSMCVSTSENMPSVQVFV